LKSKKELSKIMLMDNIAQIALSILEYFDESWKNKDTKIFSIYF